MARRQRINVVVVAVVMTISEGALKTLLLRHDEKLWALPGDNPEDGESLRNAADRIIREHAGIELEYLEQLFTFDTQPPSDEPRLVQIVYYGLVPSVLLRSKELENRSKVNWFAEQEQPLFGNHGEIVHTARLRLMGKLSYTAVGFELLPEKFTLAELQNLYEVILGKELDKRNFRKKVNTLGILEATGEERISRIGRGRPASLYRFKPEVFQNIETKGDIFPV